MRTLVTTLVTAGKETDLIGLSVADVDVSERLELSLPDEALVVILHGVLDIEVDGDGLGQAGGRANVFEAQADAVYLPPGARAKLSAVGSPAGVAIATATLADAPAAKARIIKPADQRVNDVGQGNWARRVRTILGPEHEAGRLLVGETINPPGNWSSYPPHKHDEHRPPLEVQLEEVYLFKVDPPGGFGVQLLYDDRGDDLRRVRDGDVAVIKEGYHPVVAAPGYSLYYLWVMAGSGRAMVPFLEPQHAWLQQSG